MRANLFRGGNRFGVEEVERPRAMAGDTVIRVALTTNGGTDLHIVRGENLFDGERIMRFPNAPADQIPVRLSAEQVVPLPDLASTAIAGAEAGGARCGDAAVYSAAENGAAYARFGGRRDGVTKVGIRP